MKTAVHIEDRAVQIDKHTRLTGRKRWRVWRKKIVLQVESSGFEVGGGWTDSWRNAELEDLTISAGEP